MRRMAASVLVFEAFIALFFGLVAAKLHPSGDWVVALVLGAVCVLLSGMMRFRWAYTAGWVLQVGFIAAGFLVTDMFFLGAVFAAIWWAGLHYGAKAERIKAERMAAYESAVNGSTKGSGATEGNVISEGKDGSEGRGGNYASEGADRRAADGSDHDGAESTNREDAGDAVVSAATTSTEHPGVGTR